MKAMRAPNKKLSSRRLAQHSKKVVLKRPARKVSAVSRAESSFSSNGKFVCPKKCCQQVASNGIGRCQQFASKDDLQDEMSRLGWGFMLLGKAWRSKGASLAQLLETDHMMLHIEVIGPACELAGRARQLQEQAEDGEEWADIKLFKLVTRLSSDAAKARRGMQDAAARESLVPLLAMSILCVLGDGSEWLKGKVAIDDKWARRVVSKMRDASYTVLRYSDRALGLAPPMGRKGGYRTVLESLVGDFLDNASDLAGIRDDSM